MSKVRSAEMTWEDYKHVRDMGWTHSGLTGLLAEKVPSGFADRYKNEKKEGKIKST